VPLCRCAIISDKMTNFYSLNQFGNKFAVLFKFKFRRKLYYGYMGNYDRDYDPELDRGYDT